LRERRGWASPDAVRAVFAAAGVVLLQLGVLGHLQRCRPSASCCSARRVRASLPLVSPSIGHPLLHTPVRCPAAPAFQRIARRADRNATQIATGSRVLCRSAPFDMRPIVLRTALRLAQLCLAHPPVLSRRVLFSAVSRQVLKDSRLTPQPPQLRQGLAPVPRLRSPGRSHPQVVRIQQTSIIAPCKPC
jgi:hypothetical protein